MDIKLLKTEAEKDLTLSKDLKDLDDIFRKYLGKKGSIAEIFNSLAEMSKKDRIKAGKEANELKSFLIDKINQKRLDLAETIKGKEQWIDISLPAKGPKTGHLHPLTLIKRKVSEIFESMGFSYIEGPEIENEFYNFDALNIPKDHPARDAWDTFYLDKGLLLRTHTSPVQVRFMEKNNPPLRIFVPGRVFRHEATDASHEVNFYQIEGLMVGKDVSTANFKAVIKEFFSRFFGKKIEIRLRPSFFPFVEPGFEVDISCVVCKGKGCSVCSKTGWVEIMGAGMVHPNVLKASGINPKFWQGFAFGIGIDRLAMMKYKINDIRLFYSSDLRFLEQF
ncbi:MAG: phenylalanine--tRNA ligase subunit alpha [Candidatus Pacebacteria bacterium]|nr:phenylalanine--tRNA ligase subunit alpha [Candidatus Paceibacterota bacterium]